jgi:hypothetical protein
MKKIFLFALLIQNLFATDFLAYEVIQSYSFTIQDISVLNPDVLTNGKNLALIKAYTSLDIQAYGGQHILYFGVDLSTNAGKLLYAQFEKAYWYQQDITVRCKSTTDFQPPDRVILPKRGEQLSTAETFRFWTPVIAWSEQP